MEEIQVRDDQRIEIGEIKLALDRR